MDTLTSATEDRASRGSPRSIFDVIAPAVLALAGLLCYGGTFDAPFIYDDYNAIVDNPHVRSLWPPTAALSAPDESTVAGRPVVALSLAVNYAISGLQPWSYRLVNIALHVLCALILYGVVRRTLATPPVRSLRHAPSEPFALAAALVWLVHPLHTEVVTYVSTRTESLAALFYLLTVYAVIRGSTGAVHPYRWYLGAVAACALAMASKEIAATIPVVVLLYDGIFLSGGFLEALRRRRGLYLGLAATWLIVIALLAGGPRTGTVGLHFEGLTPLDYARTQAAVIWHYLRLALWPHPLALDYHDWPIARAFSASVWLAVVPLLGLVATTLWLIVRRSWVGFLGGWFFIILGPTSSFVPIVSEVAAERRMYLPLAAVVALVLTGLWLLLGRLPARTSALVGTAAVAAAAATLGALTVDRNRDYRDEITIWRETVRVRPNNVRALQNLGAALAQHGRPQEAVPYLERALQLDPQADYALENLGLIRLEEGRYPEAVELLSKRLERRPDDGITHLNIAKALLASGDPGRALAALEEGVRLLPDSGVARARLALLLADQGRIDEAAASATLAVELDPKNPTVQLAAGRVALLGGAAEDGAGHYRAALELDPGETEASLGLAAALARSGRREEAAAVVDALVAADPSPQAILGLALAAASSIDPEAGSQVMEAALRRRPDSPDLHLAHARLLTSSGRSREALLEYRRALELRPRWADAANSLAMLYATADDPAVRDPAEALRLAAELSAAAGDRHPVLLGTLGVALASAGRRVEAEQRLAEAVEIARAAGHGELAASLEGQLEQVRQGWPPPPQAPPP